MFKYFKWIIFLAFAWSTANAFADPSQINIYIQPPHVSGFGDVGANVMMTRIIRENYPQALIRVFVPQEAVPAIRMMDPEIGIPEEGIQNWEIEKDSIHYFSASSFTEAHPPPHADAFFTFSSVDTPKLFTQSGTTSLVFEEVGMEANAAENTIESGATEGGLYVSAQKPTWGYSREKTLELIKKWEPTLNTSEPVTLAMAYTKKTRVEEFYIESICKLAKTPAYSQKKIVLLVYKKLNTTVLPPNVKLVIYPQMPLIEIASLIKNADLPITVTGDASLSLALDYEKPFIYEMNPWKTSSVNQMMSLFETQMGKESVPEFNRNIAKFITLNADYPDPYFDSEKLSKIVSNPKFLDYFKKAIERSRPSLALINKCKALLNKTKVANPLLHPHG